MQDRKSLHTGRIKLIPVDAANGIYDIVMADEPTQVGTPLVKETLLSDVAAEICGTVNDDGTVNPVETVSQALENVGNWAKNALPIGGGEMLGDISMGGGKITNLAEPTANGDAVNKKYLDDAVSEHVLKSGDTMTGELTVEGPIASDNNACTTTLLGPILRTKNNTTNTLVPLIAPGGIAQLPTPTEDTHAANKKYVDDQIGNIQTPDTSNFATKTDLNNYYPVNGGYLEGNLIFYNNTSIIRTSMMTTTPTLFVGKELGSPAIGFGENTTEYPFSDPAYIRGVRNPSDKSDATNKQYVDGRIITGAYTGNGNDTNGHSESFGTRETIKAVLVETQRGARFSTGDKSVYGGLAVPNYGVAHPAAPSSPALYIEGNRFIAKYTMNTYGEKYHYIVILA